MKSIWDYDALQVALTRLGGIVKGGVARWPVKVRAKPNISAVLFAVSLPKL